MEFLAGEGVQRIVMTVYGITYEVLPLENAAIVAGYSTRHMRTLCDTGKLIAIKYVGRWWIPTSELVNTAGKS